ncbi:hypothetical protein DSO57_1006345 [Entomophthora muscae]|uniref:Uncharacterized protein n=1 Tax=Entomophthora muscae TaxID=34485 RepID=A0ACC2U6R2_9FUNG|nr:hypothetical protein DSO57_1006345 [Entomophthora muscae]
MGHNIHQYHIKKVVHVRDYEMDVKKGITRVNGKTYVCPKPVWWISPEVNKIFAMKAIQQSLVERHKADKEREELTNSEETGDFMDPSTPDEVCMDDGTTIADHVIHPDLREWQKNQEASNKTQKKPPNKRPAPQPSAQPQSPPKGFSLKDPKIRKNGTKKGNPIQIPANRPHDRMETDFSEAEFAQFRAQDKKIPA